MTHQHKLTPTDMGMIGIFLKPSGTAAKRRRAFWSGTPLYRQSVRQFVERSQGEKLPPWVERKCATRIFAA